MENISRNCPLDSTDETGAHSNIDELLVMQRGRGELTVRLISRVDTLLMSGALSAYRVGCMKLESLLIV